MKTRLSALLLAFAAGAAAQDGGEAFVGHWVYQGEGEKIDLVLLPDGRYVSLASRDGGEVSERGRYRVEGEAFVLTPIGAPETSLAYRLEDGTLTLQGGSLPGPMTYRRMPGSEKKVVEDAERADREKAQDDGEWARRFAAGPLEAVGVPEDPNPPRLFEDPTVFVESHVYARGGMRLHFLPTGRVYARFPDRDRIREFWGRYTIDEEDRIRFESDDGEAIRFELIDGRRNLVWGEIVFGNAAWEKEH